MTTIIKVKYVEYLSNSDDTGLLETVNREILVNINCSIKMIINYIRKVARVNGEFDLCDEINCQPKIITFYEPCTRGTDILQPDLTYFIVTFERDENGQMINLTPLLIEKAAVTKKYYDSFSKIQRSPSQKLALNLCSKSIIMHNKSNK
ncbi:PREDICTED: uncharacterized protein CXorf65 homolog [Trachymyrmex septentrionalis]|uniref:uncharacterized protein CXorf65 homolog n=1 Tax=Trachymyrmex septentrionalis TaxID=34720 RepID=UPI00084F3C1B|nr:PREDICTED: uncharacterized protein CXorf65 homolog [Trachymyrmex septentrionalis]